jgi:hypothetical protein
MILDGYLMFTNFIGGGTGTGDSPTTGTQVSTNQLDLGIIGLPLSASGGGARDIGIGDDPAMKIAVIVTTTFTGGTSLQVNIQGAPDNGSGAPGSYTTMLSGPVVVEANLLGATSTSFAGTRVLDVDMPRPAPAQALPRFIQLQYITVGTHTAGAVKGFLVLDRNDIPLGTTAALSGYPAGITIAN